MAFTCCTRPPGSHLGVAGGAAPVIAIIAGPEGSSLAANLRSQLDHADATTLLSRTCRSAEDFQRALHQHRLHPRSTVLTVPNPAVVAHTPPLTPPHAAAVVRVLAFQPFHGLPKAPIASEALQQLADYGTLLQPTKARRDSVMSLSLTDLRGLLGELTARLPEEGEVAGRILESHLSEVWGMSDASRGARVFLEPRQKYHLVTAPSLSGAKALTKAMALAGQHHAKLAEQHEGDTHAALPSFGVPDLCASCAAAGQRRMHTSYPFCGHCLSKLAASLAVEPVSSVPLPVSTPAAILRGSDMGLAFEINASGGAQTNHFDAYPFDLASPVFPERVITQASGTATPIVGSEPANGYIGLAIGAGGLRGVACAVGQLRALSEFQAANAGKLTPIHYISAGSTAAWAPAVLFYSQKTDEELLGLPALPGDLVLQAPASATDFSSKYLGGVQAGSILSIATRVDRDDFATNYLAKSAYSGISKFCYWQKYVNDNVLSPYISGSTLDTWKQPFAFAAANPTSWVSRAAGSTSNSLPAALTVNRTPRPFLIMNLAVTQQSDTTTATQPGRPLVVVESTPMYTGVPVFTAGSATQPDLGGGWVDTFAFGSSATQNGTLKVSVKSVTDPTSGSVLATGTCNCAASVTSATATRNLTTGTTKTSTTLKNPANWTTPESFAFDCVLVTNAKLNLLTYVNGALLGSTSVDLISIPAGSTTPLAAKTDNGKAVINVDLTWTTLQPITTDGLAPAISSSTRRAAQTQSRPFSLADALGASSHGITPAGTLASSDAVPRYPVSSAPVKNGEQLRNTPQASYFDDTADVEPTGVVSLVRRGVRRIVACINSGTAVSTADVATQFAALFGMYKAADGSFRQYSISPYSPLNQAEADIFRNNQVFSSSEFATVMNGLAKKKGSTMPTYDFTHTVVANAAAGIAKGYSARVLWVYNDVDRSASDWAKVLSADGKSALAAIATTPAPFPLLDEAKRLTTQEAGLLANLHYFGVKAALSAIGQSFFGN